MSGGPPAETGGVGMDGRGHEVPPEGREGSGVPPGVPGWVGRALSHGRAVLRGPPIWMARGFGSPPIMARRRRQSLMEAGRGCEALPEGWEGSEGPPGGNRGL